LNVAKGRGLGKGLSSLMGSASIEVSVDEGQETKSEEMSLALISPNPNQPRSIFDEEKIAELAASIKKDGLLQPILVRPYGDGYQIVAGERRYQASKKAGLVSIPVRILEVDDVQAQEIALIENLQRDDLNPIEEAWGYRRLMEDGNYKQKDLAEIMSKNPSTISNALRLLDLPDEVQELMYDGKLSAGHARAVLSLPVENEERRIALARKIAEEKLSVREAEAAAKLALLQGIERAKKEPTPKTFKQAARKLRKRLDASVKVRTVRGRNKIEIEFIDERDLSRIFGILTNGEMLDAGSRGLTLGLEEQGDADEQ
jgi:ParB family chromosome partitioning protein